MKKNIQFCAVHVLSKLMTNKRKKKLKKRKRWWVRPWIARRQQFGAFHALMKEIKVEDPRAFANYVRMDAQQFQYLVDAVSPLIVHEDTAMHDAIPPAERLAVTLRFLAIRILHNYVNVMLNFQLFDCFSINVWFGFSYSRLFYTH